MEKIGIGMIGCGGMGIILTRLLLGEDPRFEVRAICDPDPRAIANALEKINPEARVYKNYRDLVKAKDIENVLIASWNAFHKRQTVAAFQAGKNVFCQKPLATNFADCLAMRDAWVESGRVFTIGFTLRYSPHYRKIKELLDGNAIGRIVSMEFNETLHFNHGGYIMGDWRRLRKNAGTHLLEKCCHDIDLANWMVGSLASRVASFGGLNFFRPENEHRIAQIGKSENGGDAYRTWPGRVNENPFTADKDIIDNQVAIIEYANGARATFHTNCNAGIPERRMYILGTEGAIRADVLTGQFELQRIGFGLAREKVELGVAGGHGGGDQLLARELAASLTAGTPPCAGMREGLASSITCFAIDKAMETGRVVDVNTYWKKAGIARK